MGTWEWMSEETVGPQNTEYGRESPLPCHGLDAIGIKHLLRPLPMWLTNAWHQSHFIGKLSLQTTTLIICQSG